MRIETIPLIIGAVVALFGVLLCVDAWTPDDAARQERRSAPRGERSRGGETAIGFGVLCLSAALFGRDTWAYSIVSAIAGVLLVLLGAFMNRRYIRGRLVTYTYTDVPATVPVISGGGAPEPDPSLRGSSGQAASPQDDKRASPQDDNVPRAAQPERPSERLRIR